MDLQKFQIRLKKLRDKTGLSAEALSLEMGLDKNCIWLWENGKRKPTADSICKLAKCFNVTSDYLLGLADNPN